MNRFDVAAALEEIAELLRLQGGKIHRARAWERAARAVQSAGDDLARRVENRSLHELPGIGESTGRQIEQLVREGRSDYLEKLREQISPGVLALARVVSPRRARLLHEALGVTSVPELRAAALAGRVRGVTGFGAATEQQILASIDEWERRADSAILADAAPDAEELAAYVGDAAYVARADVSGGVRRGLEVVEALAVVASGPDLRAIVERFRAYPRFVSVEDTECFASGKLPDGARAELYAVAPAAHARTLIETTGSPEHVTRLVALGGGRLPDAPSEEAIYRRLGLAYIPPELREGADEIDRAREGRLPDPLVSVDHVRGMVHCHTVWSDGRHTVAEVAAEADVRGFDYLAITDHSVSAFYAKGLSVDDLKRQWEEIDRVQESCRVQILKGTESDIQPDGSLDWPDSVLERLDVVIASVHTRLRMDPAAMTERVLRCMRLPFFKIWGHPLARILLRREPYACDLPRILDAVAVSRAAIEINGDPHRLDLAPEHVRAARERGIPIVLSTDAHSRGQMDYLRFAVTMARRAGLEPRHVLNTLDARTFRERVRPVPV